MFRYPPRNNDNSPRFIYLHRLEKLFDNRPVRLAMDENIPYRRRLFLLKRWRDERIVYLLSSFSDSAYMQDATLQKIGLHLSYLRRQRHTSRHRKSRLMERMRRRIVDPLRAVKGTPDHLHK